MLLNYSFLVGALAGRASWRPRLWACLKLGEISSRSVHAEALAASGLRAAAANNFPRRDGAPQEDPCLASSRRNSRHLCVMRECARPPRTCCFWFLFLLACLYPDCLPKYNTWMLRSLDVRPVRISGSCLEQPEVMCVQTYLSWSHGALSLQSPTLLLQVGCSVFLRFCISAFAFICWLWWGSKKSVTFLLSKPLVMGMEKFLCTVVLSDHLFTRQ